MRQIVAPRPRYIRLEGVWQQMSPTAAAKWRELTRGLAPLRAPGGRTWRLVVFAHPQCPCTRATLDVLARSSARAGARLEATVALVREAGTKAGWERG